MKKQLLVTVLAIFSLSGTCAYAETSSDPNYVANFLNYNKLKYGSDLIMVGTVNASVSEKIKTKPDRVEFSISYITEGSSPSEASDKNATNMKSLTDYLQQLGIKQQDLTTISYKNYEQTAEKPLAKAQDKLYETAITVNVTINSESFYEVIAVLEKNGIGNLEKTQPTNTFYTFTILEKATDEKTAKQLAQEKYKKLVEQLKTKNVSQMSIEKYNNQQNEPEKQEVKTYFVENTIKVRTHHFDLLGKIIAKAQQLKMSVNNDMVYSVSDETRNKLIAESESQLLSKLTEKAKLLLGNKEYQLGVPQNLQLMEEQSIIHPRQYAYNSRMMVNSAPIAQEATGTSIDIQAPTDFDITVNLSGYFEILKPVHKP